MLTDFVDRVDDMDRLRSLVAELAQRQGRCLVVEGGPGMGKTALLAEFARRTAADAAPDLPCRVVATRCYAQIGSSLSYVPAVDILYQLATPAQRSPWWRRALGQAGKTAINSAPDVLSSIVPGLGAFWTAGREIAAAAVNTTTAPLDSVMPVQLGTAVRVAEAILDAARSGPATVVVVDDVQNIDPSSLMIIDRLVRGLQGQPLSLVLSYARDARPASPAAAVEELMDTWIASRLAERRSLGGLPTEAIAELVRSRHPSAPAELPGQLAELTSGHPMFVSLCLDEWNAGNGARIVLPPTLNRVVENRLRALDDPDRDLVVNGAAQGSVFLSRVVAELAGRPHELVMERLRRIAADHRLIVRQDPPAWAEHEPADCYRFEHRALWQVVYDLQTGEQRRSRHARIAQALSVGDPDQAPWGRRLEIAHHLDHAGPGSLAASAQAHYRLARSAALDGLSFVEAEQHCETAITAARDLPADDTRRDEILITAIELLLSLTEVRWRGQHQPAGGPDIDALAAEAEQAAARCGDRALIARTTLLRGKTLLATQGLVPSLDKLREAVEQARRTSDPVALFVARVEYGRQLSKRDLAAGLAQLREVERMYASDPGLDAGGDPVLQHARNLAQMQLAISLYDSGHLTDALTRLQNCVERLRGEVLCAELPIALNYLAQVHTAMGRPEAAERVLREARDFEERRGGDSGWHAYNTALLALLLSTDPDDDRREQSRELIEQAWLETENTWLANLVPIVRNLYAETLLNHAALAAARPREELLEQAVRLAVDTCVETEQTGMVRSQIAALVLRSRIHLGQGDTTAARALAQEALRILDRVGDMPALRSEEVLFHTARALRADGEDGAARETMEQARAEVARKADRIHDARVREVYLRDVPLNRMILADRS
ncbi:AAA family ATPase [Streptacidiphilus sp. EB129]|uniref:AAA family ATPase n=1 Tax=Streptacidiphilus sp. EB129 TaxID=3156262 RepID=UPI003511F309